MLQNRGLSSQPGLLGKILELKETHCSPHLLAFLFDCYEDVLESSVQKGALNKDDQQETLRKALNVSVYVPCRRISCLLENLVGLISVDLPSLNFRSVIFWHERRTPFVRSTGCFWDAL